MVNLMSKLYRAIIYIDDINDTFQNIKSIQDYLNDHIDIHIDFDNVKEIDTTEYIDEVVDDYPWNTIYTKQRIEEIEKFISERCKNE